MTLDFTKRPDVIKLRTNAVPGLSSEGYCFTLEADGLPPEFIAGDHVFADAARVPEPGDIVVVWPPDSAKPIIWDLGNVDAAPAEPIGSMHVVVGRYRRTFDRRTVADHS
jgi:hypothetical protein